MDAVKNSLFIALSVAALACLWRTARRPFDEQGWRDAFAVIRSRCIAGTDALFPILLALALAMSVIIGGDAAAMAGETSAPAFVIDSLMVPFALAGAVFLPILAVGVRDAFGPLEIRRRDIAAGVRWGLAMVIPVALVGLAILAISHMFGSEAVEQPSLKMLVEPDIAAWRKCFLIFSALVLSPVTEEFAFRGVVLAALAKRRGLVASVALSSIFFGAIHANLEAFLPLSCVGTCFALGYIATGRIAVPVAMHATFNAVSILWDFMAN